MTIDFAGAASLENNPPRTKAAVILKYPEAYAHLDQDAEYIILSDKTEDAIQMGYFEKTEDEAWESAFAFIEEITAVNADFGEFDEDHWEEDEEDPEDDSLEEDEDGV
jgi:hypothetical protein